MPAREVASGSEGDRRAAKQLTGNVQSMLQVLMDSAQTWPQLLIEMPMFKQGRYPSYVTAGLLYPVYTVSDRSIRQEGSRAAVPSWSSSA